MTDAEKAKKYLALFISEAKKLPYYAAEDLIDQAQQICNEIRFAKDYSSGYLTVDQVIYDYLGLADDYAWIFRESEPCETCGTPNACYSCYIDYQMETPKNDFTKTKKL